MADRKIDPNTAAVLEELSRRTKYEPYTEAFPATEPAPSASPLGPKPSHDGPKSFFSSILGDKSWFPRRPKYYSSFDSSLPADPSEWTDEQREQAEKRAKIWYVNAGPGTAGPSPLAAGTFGLTSGAILGFVGSTLQNAVQNHNHGWKGVFTRTGGTIWSCGELVQTRSGWNETDRLMTLCDFLALAGAVYGSVDAGLRQYRNKADAWNKFSGGCAAGFLIGMQRMSPPHMLNKRQPDQLSLSQANHYHWPLDPASSSEVLSPF